MSRHLVKEGNTVGWKKDPTEEDYILTYEKPDTIGWKQGPEERTVLTKDGGLVGWRDLKPKETFPGEVKTGQIVSELWVEYDWGNLPTSGAYVLTTEGFLSSIVWNPTTQSYSYGGNNTSNGNGEATFGVDVHLEIIYTIGDGPYPQTLYKRDVPAGTKVYITGYQLDNLFQIGVSGPGVSFSHTHHYNGMIEARVWKL